MQILEGLGNAVFCRRPRLFSGSRMPVAAIYGVSIWDDVLGAVVAMAECLLTAGGQDFTCAPLLTT